MPDSSTDHGDQQRISVSHSLLRAELAEMELRLRIYFDEQLKHKADAAPFLVLSAKVEALDRGDFTPVHRRALIELIEQQGAVATDKQWTSRERIFGAIAVLVAVVSFAFTVYVATAAASPDTPAPTPTVSTTEGT